MSGNHHILDAFKRNHPIVVTRKMLHDLVTFCHIYETKSTHAQALNTPLMGVYPIYFQATDQRAVFDILGHVPEEVMSTIDTIPTIDPEHVVTSDPYNLMTVWAAHCIMTAPGAFPRAEVHAAMLALFKLMHYKFYTSLMVKNFKFKADPAVMQETIRKLSNKFDIVQEGTWRKAIESRSEDLIGPQSIHLKTLKNFDDDKAIIYCISDTQTRLRNKIQLIVSVYYDTKEQNEALGSYSLVDEVDGDKVIGNVSNIYNTMISNLASQALNVYTFVDNELVGLICHRFSALRPDMFRAVLTRFSEQAMLQSKSGKLDEELMLHGQHIYSGSRLLLTELIQKTYRHCSRNGVNMKSKAAILTKVQNLYSSSRVSDADILKVKQSVLHFVASCGQSTRPATLASLAIGFIVYIIVRSFAYM